MDLRFDRNMSWTLRGLMIPRALVLLALGVWLVTNAALWAADNDAVTTKTASSPSLRDMPANYATDAEIIAYINAEIAKAWADAGLSPSTRATDNEWCRRVYLDLVGRIPTVQELQKFLSGPVSTKRAALLDRLLDSDDYVEEYARNFTTHWTNLLIGRPPARRNRRDPTSRDGMQQYLRSSFLNNKPYDKMVYELVSATGSTAPGKDNYNGATNFLIGKLQENATEATSKTAKYFLGLQVQCTQCHNHPFNDWKQDQFWSLNAFFRQTDGKPQRTGREIENAVLANRDFRGEGGNSSTPKEAEIYFELRNGQMQVAYPKFVDGTTIDPSGYVKEVDRRAELGKLIVKSEYLGKAIVNRYWAHFLGYGFTKPVDDLGPHNAPSHPELLDRLGKEFSSHGHDLRQLIRWIVLSEPYALSSKATPKNVKDDPSLGEKPRFSHFYLRQMGAEELYESLLVIRNEHRKGDYAENEGRKANILSQFNITFGNDEGEEATTFNGSIPQALMLMNGEMTKNTTSTANDSFLYKLVMSASGSSAVDILFEAALSRKPSGQDLAVARQLFGGRTNALTAYQDLLWSLINSNEFIFIH